MSAPTSWLPIGFIDPPNPYGPDSEWVDFLADLDRMPDCQQVRTEREDALRHLREVRTRRDQPSDAAAHLHLLARTFEHAAQQEEDPELKEQRFQAARGLRSRAMNTPPSSTKH
jgi:hypothetical protein